MFAAQRRGMRLLLLSALAVVSSTFGDQSEKDLAHWETFKIEYEKTYTSKEEEETRKNVFFNNLKLINEHNLKFSNGEVTFTMGVNRYTDMTRGEVIKRMTGYRAYGHNLTGEIYQPDPSQELPDTLDWRQKGAVTPVKDQGLCGSCWAFSTTGTLEGAWFLKSKQLVSLSEQNLLDCDKKDKGCNGGYPARALQYVVNNKGIDTEQAYPYEEKQGKCRYNRSGSTAEITGVGHVTKGDEESLKSAVVNQGPISVGIVTTDNFMSYTSGVFSDSSCAGKKLDHGVLVVGYGTLNGQDYWLVKNSWGTSWGMEGYIMMARNKNNMCGIASDATYAKV